MTQENPCAMQGLGHLVGGRSVPPIKDDAKPLPTCLADNCEAGKGSEDSSGSWV